MRSLCRAVPLLGDLDLGKSRDGRRARTIGVGAPVEVVLLSVDEHDDVGVLFDASAVAKVRELRPFVGPILHLAAQLRKASTGTSSSLARVFSPRVISETSCTRPSFRFDASRSCR
jgi:hypothetical protein